MLATICQVSKPEEVTNVGIAIKPRKVHNTAIVIKADLSSGTLRTNPTAENANIVQANIKLATNTVLIGASIVPCCADSITCCGARANSNQLGPPKIQSRCQIAEAEARKPALINNFDWIVKINVNSFLH